MKKKLISLLAAGTVLVAAGCDQNKNAGTAGTPAATPASAPAASAPAVSKADAVAEVNGKYIAKSTLEDLEKEIAQRAQGQTFPKAKLVEELVQRELLIQDAQQKHLDQSPELVEQLESARKTLLTQADLQAFLKSNPVTDAEIKAEYDSKVVSQAGTEFKARHILVKTEEEAKKLIAALDKGGDFAKLANENTLDNKEAQKGGDLGWFTADQMVEPFSKAVAALEKGKYTKEPVKTQFGYHVILREDSRAQTPPPLDAVKDQLVPYLQRKKVQTMVENLKKQAKIEILIPLDEKAKAPAEAPKPAEAAKGQDGSLEAGTTNPGEPAKAEPAKAEPAKAEPAKKAESAKK